MPLVLRTTQALKRQDEFEKSSDKFVSLVQISWRLLNSVAQRGLRRIENPVIRDPEKKLDDFFNYAQKLGHGQRI
jgi:hypothetical protein